jgi:predicted metalloenzyme YecM
LRCYEIETKQLLKLCLETGHVVSGGDFNGNLIKLIPLQELKKICSNEFDLKLEGMK